mmetsp:Transcript_65607/g.132015  ORF Transcript_65607/g.132015 Transcript_65607/m.132015 type:complete len:713 (+) Transcript_65607:280-2418(+)
MIRWGSVEARSFHGEDPPLVSRHHRSAPLRATSVGSGGRGEVASGCGGDGEDTTERAEPQPCGSTAVDTAVGTAADAAADAAWVNSYLDDVLVFRNGPKTRALVDAVLLLKSAGPSPRATLTQLQAGLSCSSSDEALSQLQGEGSNGESGEIRSLSLSSGICGGGVDLEYDGDFSLSPTSSFSDPVGSSGSSSGGGTTVSLSTEGAPSRLPESLEFDSGAESSGGQVGAPVSSPLRRSSPGVGVLPLGQPYLLLERARKGQGLARKRRTQSLSDGYGTDSTAAESSDDSLGSPPTTGSSSSSSKAKHPPPSRKKRPVPIPPPLHKPRQRRSQSENDVQEGEGCREGAVGDGSDEEFEVSDAERVATYASFGAGDAFFRADDDQEVDLDDLPSSSAGAAFAAAVDSAAADDAADDAAAAAATTGVEESALVPVDTAWAVSADSTAAAAVAAVAAPSLGMLRDVLHGTSTQPHRQASLLRSWLSSQSRSDLVRDWADPLQFPAPPLERRLGPRPQGVAAAVGGGGGSGGSGGGCGVDSGSSGGDGGRNNANAVGSGDGSTPFSPLSPSLLSPSLASSSLSPSSSPLQPRQPRGVSSLGEASIWSVDEFETLKPELRAAAAAARGQESGGVSSSVGGSDDGSLAPLLHERAAVSHVREKHQKARRAAASTAASGGGGQSQRSAVRKAQEKRPKGRHRHRHPKSKSPSQELFGSSF